MANFIILKSCSFFLVIVLGLHNYLFILQENICEILENPEIF